MSDDPASGRSRGAHVDEALLGTALEALAHYDVSPRTQVRLLEVSENATFRLDDPVSGSTSVLRLHRLDYHERNAVESELDWVHALRRDGVVRTPAVLPSRDGRRVVQVTPAHGGSERLAVRFEFLPGAAPEEGDGLSEEFEALGELTARMHDHASTWTRPRRFVRFSWDPASVFGRRPRWGRWQAAPGVGRDEQAVLARALASVQRRLAAFGAGPQRWGLIHADMRLANLLIDPDGAVSVIDFDDCGHGWYLYDLATALSFFEHKPHVPELVERWLTGYRGVRPLPSEDEAEIWTFVLFRRLLLLAWIGSHPRSAFARAQASDFAQNSCVLAERYMSRHG